MIHEYKMHSKQNDKALIKFAEIQTPPMSEAARIKTGYLLRKLQQGEVLSMPQSRSMGTIGSNCHELRIPDEHVSWRVIYCIHSDAIVVLEIFSKKTGPTPKKIIETCRMRLKNYLDAIS